MTVRLFADDTTLFIDFDEEVEAANNINGDLATISKWAEQRLVSFCPSKTGSLLVSLKNRMDPPPPITFGASVIKEVTAHKHLGVIFSSNLSWGSHIEDCINRAGRRVDVLARLMYRLDRNTLEIIYKPFIRPVLEYGDILMSNITEEQSALIEQVNKRAGSIISGAIRGTSSAVLHEELSWVSMEMRRKQRRLLAFHKIVHNSTTTSPKLFATYCKRQFCLQLSEFGCIQDDPNQVRVVLQIFLPPYGS